MPMEEDTQSTAPHAGRVENLRGGGGCGMSGPRPWGRTLFRVKSDSVCVWLAHRWAARILWIVGVPSPLRGPERLAESSTPLEQR